MWCATEQAVIGFGHDDLFETIVNMIDLNAYTERQFRMVVKISVALEEQGDFMAILIADGLKKIDKDALDFCLICEGDIYYHDLKGGKRLLKDLLTINPKCIVTEVDDEELVAILDDDVYEAHIFYEHNEKKITLAVIIACGLFALGILIGKGLKNGSLTKSP